MRSLSDIWNLVIAYTPDQPMLFNSGLFLALFTVFIAIYAVVYPNKTVRTVYVLAFSLFFYYKSSGAYIIILLLSIVLDYLVALGIYQSRRQVLRKLLLAVSVIANVALLCYFKYTNFFLENINLLTGSHINPLDLFLPIGISFYTFQTISYVVDVYKGEIEPARNLIDYAFYMSFFPHLVAGPIVRARHFLPQINQKINLTQNDVSSGFFLVLKGLMKKAIIADYVAQYADMVFSTPDGYSGFENLIAIYAYTLQIYCDFSGYSDMAIGLAKMMGFDLGDNFRSPYIAVNITDFWRRWHISLSSWLRDYVYIPLGGNRKGELNQYVFLFLTMLIGGFWHGASWKFVFWGAMHGAGLIGHKYFMKITGKKWEGNALITFFSWFLTFHFVALLWVFFRADSFQTATTVISKALFETDWSYWQPFLQTRALFCFLLFLGYAIHFVPKEVKQNMALEFGSLSMVVKAIIFLVVIQMVLQIQSEDVQPFIYFQF
jgi:D-alanyl-lipoteichoic acid acyltransferase DltB (MBOAT superfamily)